ASLAWSGLAVAAAGLVNFGVAGGIALATRSDLDEICVEGRCPSDREDEIAQGRVAAHAATVGLAVAGAGGALAIVAAVVLSGNDEGKTTAVVPLVGPGFVGLWWAF